MSPTGISFRTVNAGPPFVPSLYNNNVQILRNEHHAVIITEMIYDTRIVPLGDRPPLYEAIGLWSGAPRGYWDGDTRVVESRNFNGLTQSFGAFGMSKDKMLTERFSRIGPYTVAP